ncbi:DUF2182 domain-containing protein [Halovivax limisalsi]|uniref:DUF2182 domain-containing protein n=1 Tax=Halovivax limisalsi TaxID=1453760 RepID=UPI001FFD19A3|nr:DUF2182 domain-containing protein [Halovivax limisalsi]
MIPDKLRSSLDRVAVTDHRLVRRLGDRFDALAPPIPDTLVLSLAALLWLVLLAGWLPDLGPPPARVGAPMAAPGVPEAMATSNGLDGALAYLLMWGTMMLAMMLPSLVSVARRIREAVCPTPRILGRSVAAFLLAYGLVWTLVGTVPLSVATLLGLRDLLTGSVFGMDAGRLLLGGLLAFAGAYQFTGLKRDLLALCACGRPVPHRPSVTCMFRDGLRYAANCVGCTWPLFAALVAMGSMNVVAMAGVTLVVVVERIAPRSDDLARAWGVVLFGAAAVALTLGVPY